MGIKTTKKNKSGVQTFTYFIPAPPTRKNGYREKEFDKIMNGILESGFTLIELHTQSVPTGLFVVAILKGSAKAKKLDQDLDIHERFKLTTIHESPDIVLEEEEND